MHKKTPSLLVSNITGNPLRYDISQQDGVLVLNKPSGITSAACLSRIKYGFNQKKIGHAGTLDPMASGVLLVLLGQGTKLSGFLLDQGEKVYSGVVHLGIETDTWDAEGTVLDRKDVPSSIKEEVYSVFLEFIGSYEQEVPAYSAAKHKGQPLYALARKGLETPVKKKLVTIFDGEIESVDLPFIRFRVRCSSGTYIRSLAHSLGKRLGCGGMLCELTREYSYPFGLDSAYSFDELQNQPEKFSTYVHGIANVLHDWPRYEITGEYFQKVQNGNSVPYGIFGEQLPFCEGTKALFEDSNGIAIALASATNNGGLLEWKVLRGLWNQKP